MVAKLSGDRPADRGAGINCPRCRVRLLAARTTAQTDGSVKRVRRCPKCPYKTVTVERVQGGRG